MTRHLTESSLLIASHNKGKLKEFKEFLEPYGIEVISAADMNLREPEETGATFAENAIAKAKLAAKASGMPAIADDSGLCVNALDGKPGIYSARWFGREKDPMVGMTRVHSDLGDSPDRSAYFICVLAVAWPDGHIETVEGRCDGFIVWPPQGSHGFGYDPIFMPKGHNLTFGQMSHEEKQSISHRRRALDELFKKIIVS